MIRSARSLLVPTLLASALACPKTPPPAAADAGPAAQTHAPAQAPKRPPYPNMATAAYGQQVLEDKLRTVLPQKDKTKLDAVLAALHEQGPGSEENAASLALAAYKTASTDVERGTAVALLAAALVLEPTVEGYKERLTDAFGLAGYAGTLDATDAVGQAARALVDAAAGASEQARRLVQTVSETPHVSPEARLFTALARKAAQVRDTDAVVDDLEAAIAHRKDSVRARALLAELYLDLGLAEKAAATAHVDDAPGGATGTPWLAAIEGRALVLDGKVAEGVRLLREVEPKVEEGRRGDALYWLGRSLSQSDAWQSEVPPIASALEQRPGFVKEAKTLQALVLLMGGDPKGARALLEPLARGPAALAVDVDLAWLLVDACAGAGDLRCVEEQGKRALALDGDEARFWRARAQCAIADMSASDTQAKSEDARAEAIATAQRQAHRLSPFEDKLAAVVKEPASPGGAKAAQALRSARKAVVRGAPKLALAALGVTGAAPSAKSGPKECRACLAVVAAAQDALGQLTAGADAALAALALPKSVPELADSDLVVVIDALGGVADARTKNSLDALANDPREAVKRAVAQARADHKDPDARKRRAQGQREGGPQ